MFLTKTLKKTKYTNLHDYKVTVLSYNLNNSKSPYKTIILLNIFIQYYNNLQIHHKLMLKHVAELKKSARNKYLKH